MTKFFSEGPAPDPRYVFCRDSFLYESARELVETLWTKYAAFCPDQHFLTDARSHFVERAWEMYLACVLMEKGFTLRPTLPTGPDICIDMDPPIWVEAVAVSAGVGPDRVPDRDSRGYSYSPEPGITRWHGHPPNEASVILRCTSALEAKRQKYIHYRHGGVVKRGEACVVAISLAGVEDAECNHNNERIPLMIKTLFGLGEEYLAITMYSDAEPKAGYHFRPEIKKVSGANVSSEAFASTACSEISGVFGTCTSIWNVPDEHGREILFVNNPNAEVAIPAGTFAFGTEFVASKEHVRRAEQTR